MATKIWAYTPGSATAIRLAARLDARVLASEETTRYNPRRGDTIINYGNSRWSERIDQSSLLRNNVSVINNPYHVGIYSNKRTAFDMFEDFDTATVPYTTNPDTAQDWLRQGYDVIARHKLHGHSGEGIQVLDYESYGQDRPEYPMVAAPLYTLYVKKSKEWRVHMIRSATGEAHFKWQQKRRRMDCAEPNWTVRNYENGFIYAVEDVVKPENYLDIQEDFCSNIDLRFGAIDLIMPNNANTRIIRNSGPMFLELNTSPGLQSETMLDWYTEHLQGYINR